MNLLNIDGSAQITKYEDGNLVKKMSIKTNYDGKQLDLLFDNDGSKSHMMLDNKTLMKLLNQTRDTKNMNDRLLEDFPLFKPRKLDKPRKSRKFRKSTQNKTKQRKR